MQDLVLKISSIIISILILTAVYVTIDPHTTLEVIGTLSLLATPFRFIAKSNYKFLKEI